jgi:hypothetical protein
VLVQQRRAPDEILTVELHPTPEAGRERRRRIVELVSVQRQAGFEAKRVACAETDWLDAALASHGH